MLRTGDSQYRHKFPRSDYISNFTTSSILCTPWLFEVFEQVGANYVKSSERVFIEASTQDLVISTYGPMSKVWYLSPLTHGNRAYMPLNVTVAPANNSVVIKRINRAPEFLKPFEDQIVYINRTSTFAEFQLPPIVDDMNRFA